MNGKKYILDNYNKYGFKCEGHDFTRSDMVDLLNILEANGETLDDLHDAIGEGEFCGIFRLTGKGFLNDNDIISTLFENFFFIPADAWTEYKSRKVSEYISIGLDEADFLDYITETEDGFVYDCRC